MPIIKKHKIKRPLFNLQELVNEIGDQARITLIKRIQEGYSQEYVKNLVNLDISFFNRESRKIFNKLFVVALYKIANRK